MVYNPANKPAYNGPVAGQPITSIIQKEVKTPKLKVKFSNVVNPFRYPNSPTIPRWSVTCLIDPEQDHEFISQIEKIERSENIKNSHTLKEDVFKNKDGQMVKSGKYLLKFQTRDKIPLILMKAGESSEPMEAKEEISTGERVIVVFNVVRYTKKGVTSELNKGISYQPTLIYLYSSDDDDEE